MPLPQQKGLLGKKKDTTSFESRTFPTLTSQSSKIQRKRLLFAYLIAMAAIFGTSGTAIYLFFTHSLNEQLNHELLLLAQAAVPSLEIVETKGLQGLKNTWGQKLPWHHFFEREQGLEWFDNKGKLLAKEGTTFPDSPLTKSVFPGVLPDNSSDKLQHKGRLREPYPHTVHLENGQAIIEQHGQIRSLTVSVYIHDPNKKTLQLKGFIRASESTKEMKAALNQFQAGLEIGGIIALILSGITGLYLAQLAVEPVKQSFQRLKQFTADASHELRNPLTAISTTVEVMQSNLEEISPSEAKKLEIISSATAQLTHLVEDLLFLARTDATSAPNEFDGSPIPLDEVLEDVVERFELQAQSKGIDFQSHLQAGVFVKGDANQLLRLFSNLVENALKYTKTGGRVSLLLERRRRFALVCVEDTGRGIPCEYLPFIFQRFWRVDKVRSQQKEGVGLGLAIAHAIVQRHNGKIKVSSKVGVGSCFRVYLPFGSS